MVEAAITQTRERKRKDVQARAQQAAEDRVVDALVGENASATTKDAFRKRLRAGELRLDVVLCSPYKFFGPHLGIATIRPDLAESLPADRVRPAEETPPGHRFEAGTQSHEAVAGATAAIDYLREDLGDDWASANLVLDGTNSVLVRTDDMLIDVVRRGQGVLNIVPLAHVMEELDAGVREHVADFREASGG